MPLTPNNREEHWLQGMVDGQTTLEPNKRREYWYKEIVDAIGSGGGGGGGGEGALIVHFDYDESPTYVYGIKADKTLAEVETAYDAGTPVFGTYVDGGINYWLILSHIDRTTSQHTAQFANIRVGQNGMEWLEIDMPVSETHINVDWKTITAN